jgi:hypothetical protein
MQNNYKVDVNDQSVTYSLPYITSSSELCMLRNRLNNLVNNELGKM